MAKAYTCYTIDVPFLNSASSPKLANYHYFIVQWRKLSYTLLRNALTLLVAYIRHQLNTGALEAPFH